MRLSIQDIDVEKFIQLDKEKDEIYKQKREYEKQLENRLKEYDQQCEQITKQMLSLFPKGYWWSYDIDKNWKYPKKYSIKSVSKGYEDGDFFIIVKEVFKKKPWPGFTGEHHFFFDEFSKIDIYKTEEEAKQMYSQRICPKCGGFMGFSRMIWCHKCNSERLSKMKEFEKKHRFYCPEDGNVYQVNYEDELTSKYELGFYGRHFVIKRIDTGEIIHTNNLYDYGPFEKDKESLPHIEFLEGDFS